MNKINIGKKRFGYTLMELIIYVGIIALTLSIISSLLVKVVESNRKGIALRETQENARLVLEKISSEVRWANIVYGAESGELSLGTNNGPVKFSLLGDEGDRLFVDKGGVSLEITSDKVRVSELNLSLIELDSGVRSIKIDVEIVNRNVIKMGDNISSTRLQSLVTLRN